MAKSLTTHVIEIESGIGEPAFIPLAMGTEHQPISIGKKGMWRLESMRVLDVHAFVYFDGKSLFLQSADEENGATVDGYPVGKAWTELHAPCTIDIGAARLRYRALGPAGTEERAARPSAGRPPDPGGAPLADPRPGASGAFAGIEGERTKLLAPELALARSGASRALARAAAGARESDPRAVDAAMAGRTPLHGSPLIDTASGDGRGNDQPSLPTTASAYQSGVQIAGLQERIGSPVIGYAQPPISFGPQAYSHQPRPMGPQTGAVQSLPPESMPPIPGPPGLPQGPGAFGSVDPGLAMQGAAMQGAGAPPAAPEPGFVAQIKAKPVPFITLLLFIGAGVLFLLRGGLVQQTAQNVDPDAGSGAAATPENAGVATTSPLATAAPNPNAIPPSAPTEATTAATTPNAAPSAAPNLAPVQPIASPSQALPAWPAGVPCPPPNWPPDTPLPCAPNDVAAAEAFTARPQVRLAPGAKTLERQAVDHIASGNQAKALVAYEALLQRDPNNKAVAEAARILRARLDAGAPKP